MITFYETALQYLCQWTVYFGDMRMFGWARLQKPLNGSDIEQSVKHLIDKEYFDAFCDSTLLNHIIYTKKDVGEMEQ